jgi:hypothetical protein
MADEVVCKESHRDFSLFVIAQGSVSILKQDAVSSRSSSPIA